MMPNYYIHRKVSEALSDAKKFIIGEKSKEFRSTLSDHILYVIICDASNVKKKEKKSKKKEE